MSLILFSIAMQATILMSLETVLYRPLTEDEMKIQTCAGVGDTAHEQAKDYLPYTAFIQAYAVTLIILYVCCFYPEMKRSKVDKSGIQSHKIATGMVSEATLESEVCVQVGNDVEIDNIAK